MKALIKYFKDNKIIAFGAAAGLAMNLALWLAIFFRFRQATEAVPLSYDIYFGISSTGHWIKLFKFPLIGLVIILINLFFVWRLFKKEEKIIIYFLIFSSLTAQCLLLLEGLLLFHL